MAVSISARYGKRSTPRAHRRRYTVARRPRQPRLLGYLSIADAVAPAAREAVADFHMALGMRTLLVSGDHRTTAEAAACRRRHYGDHREVLPADKTGDRRAAARRRAAGFMIGDGINDATGWRRPTLGSQSATALT